MHPYATDSNERRFVPIYIALLSLLAALLLGMFLDHISLTIQWWMDSPAVIGFYGIFYSLFNKSLWKCIIFSKIGLVKLPNLNGTWKGTAISSYDEYSKEYDATFTIRQNWHKISIVGQFEKSESYSISCSVIIEDKTGITVSYDYMNEPFTQATETMSIHRGFNRLSLNSNGKELSGPYYSGRGRRNTGELKLERVLST